MQIDKETRASSADLEALLKSKDEINKSLENKENYEVDINDLRNEVIRLLACLLNDRNEILKDETNFWKIKLTEK